MTQFLKAGEFEYHIEGSHVPRTNRYSISVFSTYSASIDPEYKRKLLNLHLTPEEFDILLAELVSIRAIKDIPLENV